MLDPVVGWVIVGAVALVLATASLHKWRARAEFAAVLSNYRLLPASAVPLMSLLVPAVETAVAVLLLLESTRAGAAAVGAALLLAYAAAIAINLRRGRRDLDCGCSGPADRRPIAAWMVWRNVLLAAVLALAAPAWAARPLGALDALTIGGSLVVLALLYETADRLLGQIMPRTAALRGVR